MLKRVSIRIRFTVINILLLVICCVGLTWVLNISAIQMVNVIQAETILPALKAGEGEFIGGKEFIENREHFMENNRTANAAIPAKTAYVARRNFQFESIAYMIFILVFGGISTYILSGYMLKPLHKLNIEMKQRTIHNLAEDLPISKNKDEVSALTCSFNEMSHKLNNAFCMQKRFSQNAAHELRTPLSVIKTKLDVFKKKSNRTKEEYETLLSVIDRYVERLSNLVQELLELTNMDALEYTQTIHIKAIVKEVLEELSISAKEKNIKIFLVGEEQRIKGNANLMYRAFYNLVENAIKYNIENGSIEIELVKIEKGSMIQIKDTGIGIPYKARELIFEPFFRVDKSRSRKLGGAGLGLSIVKNIIEQHQGEISVSDGIHGGTCFTIVFHGCKQNEKE